MHRGWASAGLAVALLACATAALAQQTGHADVPVTAPAAPSSELAPDHSPANHAPPGYTLVWADEFDGSGLPSGERWQFDTHRNRQGWYNDELQYYAANRLENSRVTDGRLIIEARAERLSRRRFPDFGGQRYTSARLFTQGRAAWTYGFFEVRAKLPCGVGTWPAIWMLPEDPDVAWPSGGEIDIMEHVGFVPGEINQSIHTTAFNHIRGTQKTVKFRVDDACDTFHRYQLTWTPDAIVIGVDDRPQFEFTRVDDDPAHWPFNRPMHLLLNIAVGGHWGGQQGIAANALPAQMAVDYVRVYQRAPTAVMGNPLPAQSPPSAEAR